MEEWPITDLDKIAKGWKTAMKYSKERLQRVHDLAADELDDAINDGHLVLETVCLFVHACIKHNQYKLPLSFWRVLHAEYGIIVYPTALTEDIDIRGLSIDVTFTEAYHGHISMYKFPSQAVRSLVLTQAIVMYGGARGIKYPPRCPIELMREPPPAYQKETPKIES
ncbi:hypothetical protein CEK26_009778 [Fusarium fujikuroi]|nr:hypothetical protein CEK27_009799 [Fusarium fujikuroi]QGI83069.1 hypothetical protein CEK25_009798 [Fusarium fujikuroi]QGI96709.1 hypothetical protein CEK26_009778 [Fusarium fujikuroi]VZI12131.1 unnamed protein product [Fusarium fujikuroi]